MGAYIYRAVDVLNTGSAVGVINRDKYYIHTENRLWIKYSVVQRPHYRLCVVQRCNSLVKINKYKGVIAIIVYIFLFSSLPDGTQLNPLCCKPNH